MRTYTTVQGDMWDSIAHNQMGDVKYTHALMKANMEHIGVYIFSSGVVLNIPEVDENKTESVLPPWKQVSG